MRVDYDRVQLLREALDADPFEQFAAWMNEACESGLLEPNPMILATVGLDGRPSQRTVLLKSFDNRGFVFYTNLESRKARQISENVNVSLLFSWLALQRQVAINGVAECVPTSEALAYFVTRPFGSQIGAWASPQSRVVSMRRCWRRNGRKRSGNSRKDACRCRPFWGGFRVVPREIEFWQGRGHRLHDRFLYARPPEGDWKIERLAP